MTRYLTAFLFLVLSLGLSARADFVHPHPGAGGLCDQAVQILGTGESSYSEAEVARISRDAERYVDGVRTEIGEKSNELNEQLRTATAQGKPLQVDVLYIGAGPHNAVAASAQRSRNPGLRMLTAEAGDRMGVFDTIRGFRVNTQEKPNESGNTVPGVPIQPRDLNPRGARFVDAKNFGDVTALAHYYADSNIAFGNRAVKVEEAPPGEKWPAKYLVTMANGNKVYTDQIVASTGLGTPRARVAHEPSQTIIDREMAKNEAGLSNSRYVPRMTVVDDFLRMAETDVAAGRNPNARFGNRIAVIGGGDGGNIAVEGALGLTARLNPRGLPPQVKVTWIGQKAKDKTQFLDSLKSDRKKERYGSIGDMLDKKHVVAESGRLIKVDELTGPGGKPYFKLTYADVDAQGNPIPGTQRSSDFDQVVFATGYDNQVLDLFTGLKKGEGEDIDFSVLKADTSDFTTNPGLQHEAPVGGQVRVGGRDQNIYVFGNAAVLPGDRRIEPTDANHNAAVGGYLDILLARTAAGARRITPPPPPTEVGALPPRIPAAASARPGYRSPRPVPIGDLGPVRHDNPTAALFELKVRAAKVLEQMELPPGKEFTVESYRSTTGAVILEFQGFDSLTQDRLWERMNKAPDGIRLREALRDYYSMQGSGLRIRVSPRADGSNRVETMDVLPVFVPAAYGPSKPTEVYDFRPPLIPPGGGSP